MGDTARELRNAWDDLIDELQRARVAIDQPERMPAPGTDRNLAEGYRYLMGFLHSAVERAFFADPAFPSVRHVLHSMNKGTIDNPDAIYFAAAIDGHERYVLRGQVGDARHWHGEPPAEATIKAPQYLIFELSSGVLAGDSGSLTELRPGLKAQTGRLDSGELQLDAEGRFEILLAPERPAGHTGNFISTWRKTSRPRPDDPTESLDRYADYLSGRQLFHDWEFERPTELTIERLDADGQTPAAYTPEAAAAELRRAGALVRGQMHFWNEFNTVLLETYGKRDGSDGERFMPRNAFNAVNAASIATGGGQSTNLYAGGVWELGPDEALVIETRVPQTPQYTGFGLANLWGESLDFANHQSSLNGHQAERDADGVTRFVLAHRDPGIPNWLDTTWHPEGYMSPRWTYSEKPAPEDWPTVTAHKVAFDEVRDHLPSGVRTVTAEERAERIRIRRRHVQLRYRSF
ncbi:MAG: hypothetical protein OEP95_14455 [Myxococcales bacterium]|nr:hypothetical protein [Myxococcales bacterium]